MKKQNDSKIKNFIAKVKQKTKECNDERKRLDEELENKVKEVENSSEFLAIQSRIKNAEQRDKELCKKLKERKKIIGAGFLLDHNGIGRNANITPEILEAFKKNNIPQQDYQELVTNALSRAIEEDEVIKNINAELGKVQETVYTDDGDNLVEKASEKIERLQTRHQNSWDKKVTALAKEAINIGLEPVNFNRQSKKCMFDLFELRNEMLTIIGPRERPRRHRPTHSEKIDIILQQTQTQREQRMAVEAL